MGDQTDSPTKLMLIGKLWLFDNLRLACQAILNSGWKNERPNNNNAYVPTQKEHFANIITHGVRMSTNYIMIISLHSC